MATKLYGGIWTRKAGTFFLGGGSIFAGIMYLYWHRHVPKDTIFVEWHRLREITFGITDLMNKYYIKKKTFDAGGETKEAICNRIAADVLDDYREETKMYCFEYFNEYVKAAEKFAREGKRTNFPVDPEVMLDFKAKVDWRKMYEKK